MEEKAVQKPPREPKSPLLAGLLSFFFPIGIGAFYNGEIIKGFIYLVIFAGLVTTVDNAGSEPFVAILLAGFYFYQIIDSVYTARRINRRVLGGEAAAEEEMEDVTRVVKSGSVFWGALLVVLGIIFLLGNFEIINYNRIFDFWPVVVIIIGIKLVLDHFSKNNK